MSTGAGPSSSRDAARFLARFPPFRDLETTRLDDIAAHAELRSFPAETVLLRQEGEPSRHLFVIRRGAVEFLDEGAVVDVLGDGELFGVSLLSGLGPALTVRTREDTECYLIDEDRARAVMGTSAGLATLAAHMTRWRERDISGRHVRRAGVDDALLVEIGRAHDVPALVEASRSLPTMVVALVDRGVDPVDIGHVVGTTIDHLTVRMIELFVDERGDPPAAFAWVALGSAARHEQALTTDQDHAIALGDGTDPADPYFEALAESVTDGLEACGIARCRGNVMAVNPAWRMTLEGWRRMFERYVADPDLMGARITGIAFDYRRVAGPVDIEATLDQVIRVAGRDSGFVHRLAMTALESRPPVGRWRDIVVKRRGQHQGQLDVKHQGITILTNLARVLAIRAGVTENRTAERLRSATEARALSARTQNDLLEAFRLLWDIRLKHHAELIGSGKPADDIVDVRELTRVTERALGGALRVIADAQARLAGELGIRRLHR
jgi:signal-transduction protein with cAMP-binding, CBS, and nucleotidyltransferase domain